MMRVDPRLVLLAGHRMVKPVLTLVLGFEVAHRWTSTNQRVDLIPVPE